MRRVAVIGLGLALTAACVLLIAYRSHYHDWPWQGAPAALSWCGRDYNRRDDPGRELRTPNHVVFRAPPLVGRQVFSDLPPAQVSAHKRQGSTCGILLFRRTAGHGFTVYTLSGGP